MDVAVHGATGIAHTIDDVGERHPSARHELLELLQEKRSTLHARELSLHHLSSGEELACVVADPGDRGVPFRRDPVLPRQTPRGAARAIAPVAAAEANRAHSTITIPLTVLGERFGLVIAWEDPAVRAIRQSAAERPDPPLEALLTLWVRQSRHAVAAMVALLNALDLAAFLVSDSGRVVGQSTRAARFEHQTGALSVRNGQLFAADAEQQASLATVLRAVCQQAPSAHRTLALRRAEESVALDFRRLVEPEPLLHGRCAIVIVRQAPNKSIEDQLQLLRNIFSLTIAEARLALDLSQGASLAVIAERQNLSRETLRSRLKRIFQKTGASRQTELVAKLQNKIGTVSKQHADDL